MLIINSITKLKQYHKQEENKLLTIKNYRILVLEKIYLQVRLIVAMTLQLILLKSKIK